MLLSTLITALACDGLMGYGLSKANGHRHVWQKLLMQSSCQDKAVNVQVYRPVQFTERRAGQ